MKRKAFVVGWPISHSRSPLIHRHWLRRYAVDGDYLPEAVSPEGFDAFLAALAASGYVGGNVTLPHKEAAFRACAETTAVARRLQAVNTLWVNGEGGLQGDNTDVYGFTSNLDEQAPEWRGGGAALVIGAGGASRAVLQALIDAGFRSVLVLNRTVSRAEALAAHFGAPVFAGGLGRLTDALAEADLVVNTTSAGLHTGEGLDIAWKEAKGSAIATDLVYVPLVTPFLQGAQASGLKIVDGLGMLLHQAAPAFEKWFGIRPKVTPQLRRLIEQDIRAVVPQ